MSLLETFPGKGPSLKVDPSPENPQDPYKMCEKGCNHDLSPGIAARDLMDLGPFPERAEIHIIVPGL